MRIATAVLPCLALGLAAITAAPASAQNTIAPVTFATAEPTEFAQLVTAPLPPSRASAAGSQATVRPAPARVARTRTEPAVQRVAYVEQLPRRAEARWPLSLRPHVFAIGTVY